LESRLRPWERMVPSPMTAHPDGQLSPGYLAYSRGARSDNRRGEPPICQHDVQAPEPERPRWLHLELGGRGGSCTTWLTAAPSTADNSAGE
jgi:hypothetical protein